MNPGYGAAERDLPRGLRESVDTGYYEEWEQRLRTINQSMNHPRGSRFAKSSEAPGEFRIALERSVMDRGRTGLANINL